jgi:hypothetical protein
MIEREIVFEDRTPAHADHVGFGFERKTTAAVGESTATRLPAKNQLAARRFGRQGTLAEG